jgi:hypothetical protein
MRPQADVILKSVGTNLLTKYVPKLGSDNERAEVALMAFLMGAVSEEFDRAAHRRIEENTALRKLFAKSFPVVKDDELKTRLEDASKEKETDWRVSSLDKSNCALIELLIELHAHVEMIGDDQSRDLEKDIWEELKGYARRREFMTWELSEALLLEARKGQ